MAKTMAKNGIILIGGYSLSTMAAQYEIDYNTGPIEVTGFTDGWKNYIPGMFQGQMSIDMYWDSAASSTNDALKSLAKRHVTIIPAGYTLGNDCFSMYAEHADFKPQADPGGALMVGSVVFQTSGVDGGPLPSVVLAHATITTTTTGTGFVDPSDAQVTQRCAGVLHVWDATATDTYVVKIQDSANNIDFNDLITFTANGTALTSEMQVVASGTIDKYRRVLATRTGAAGDTFGYTVTFWHGGF